MKLSGGKPGLTKVLYCSLAILLGVTLPSFSAQAGIWDDLPKEEQELVQKRTLEELGKMLNQGEPSEELQFIGDNIGRWATHLAQIADGEHDQASAALMKYAGDKFVESFESELKKRVGSLESPSLDFVYTTVISHKDEASQMAILALRKDFDGAGKIAWDTAEKDVIAAIKEKTDTTLDFAFNWVFNDAKIAGMGPSQIFREVIRVEKILIKEMGNYLRNTQQNQILNRYKESLKNGKSHEGAWLDLISEGTVLRAWSVGFKGEENVKRALKLCTGPKQKYDSLEKCIRDVQTRSKRKLQLEKDRTQNVLKAIEAQQQARTDEAYKQVQKLILKIIAEHSQEYKDAIGEANSILKKLQRQANGMQGDCTAYGDKETLLDSIAAKVKAAKIAAAKLRGYTALADECKILSDAPDELDIILQGMNQAKGSFDMDIGSVANHTDLVCQETGTIASAFSRAEGRKILDRALKQQQELGLAISKSQASAQLIRGDNTNVETAVKALRDQIAQLEKSFEKIGDIDAELEKLEAVKGAHIDYEAALSELKAIVNRLTTRKENMEKANPLVLSLAEQALGLAVWIDPKGKTTIETVLARYKDIPQVQTILKDMKAAYADGKCANEAIESSGATTNFEKLKWEPLKPPLGDLITKVNETRTDCQRVPDASRLDKYAASASAIALDMEAQELPWIYQKQAEQCIAAGLQAYESLADPSSALRGQVQQLEGVCGAASAKADSALGSATSAAQQSESILPAGTLAAQAQAKTADINACADLDNIRGRVAQSASEARGALGNAQAAAAHGTGIARACASQATLGAVDGDLNNIANNLRDAVVALGKVQEGDKQFDRVVGTAKQAQADLQEVWNKLSQLVLVRSGVGDHVKSAGRSRDAAVAGFENCQTAQSALVAKAESLRGSVADETLAGLLLRIRAVATEPGDKLSQINQLIAVANKRIGDLDTANSLVDGLRASAKSQCTGKESPYADVLSTMQAVLTIKELSRALNLEKGKCLAKLAANTPSGRGDYPGHDKDQGNIDQDRVASSGGGAPPVGGESRAGSDPEQQNSARGGTPLDPNYRSDPMADEKRDAEHARNAERVASAANPRRRDPRSGNGDISDYAEPDMDDRPGGGKQDNDRDRPSDKDNGEDNNGREDRSEPNPADPTNPGSGEENDTEPDAPKPEPQKPEPPKPEQPVTPPAPPPAPPKDNTRCTQIMQGLQAQTNNIMTIFSNFQAAAAAEDEAAAHRIGCQILEQTDQILDSFNQLSREGCPIKGDTTSLRDTMRRMQSQIKTELRDECGVSTAPAAENFAGKWNSRGTCPSSGNDAFRWVVSLSQNGNKVSGSIHFHQCPGGGAASYSVSGTAGSGSSVTLRGTFTGGRGPLGSSASKSKNFTVSKNGPPSPNYAP